MGWEKRGNRDYFYTAERVNGRVVKRYVGTGRVAELTAQLDAIKFDRAATDAENARQARADVDSLTAMLDPLHDLADAMTAAALLAAGFHRHHRGPWRKRRA